MHCSQENESSRKKVNKAESTSSLVADEWAEVENLVYATDDRRTDGLTKR